MKQSLVGGKVAKYNKLQCFYASDEWQTFRAMTIVNRTNERGQIICEHCNRIIIKATEITLHHIIELTPENVDDALISLNPENIQIVHHECHNKIHGRFGYSIDYNVYIVFGPPLGGMKQFVMQRMSRGDLVVDMDRLYESVTMLPVYDKPNNLLSNVRGIYNQLLDNIKTRYGKWNTAWIIGGYADKYKREKTAKDLGAELVFCNVSKEECYTRLKQSEALRNRQDEWKKYIDKWFINFIA